MVERCAMCGAVIPEGSHICRECYRKYAPEYGEGADEELRDIEDVLKIGENTDRHLQKGLEAILRIAGRRA